MTARLPRIGPPAFSGFHHDEPRRTFINQPNQPATISTSTLAPSLAVLASLQMADFEAKEASEAAPAVAVSAETAPTSPGCFSSLSAPQATRLLHAFTHFLTLALHTLLHQRALYPPETFATVRALNMPIHQSRHPGVCTWVGDAVAAVAAQLRDATVERVCFVVHAPAESRHAVLERWVFDVSSFPAWGSDSSIGNGDNANANASGAADPGTLLIWSDVYEALRGALRRIAYAAESMPPPPDGSTFTLALELRDSAPAPISVRFPFPPC